MGGVLPLIILTLGHPPRPASGSVLMVITLFSLILFHLDDATGRQRTPMSPPRQPVGVILLTSELLDVLSATQLDLQVEQ